MSEGDGSSPAELRDLAARIEALPAGPPKGTNARHLNTLAAYALGWTERRIRTASRRENWAWHNPAGERRSFPNLTGPKARETTLLALRAKADAT